MSNNAKPDPKNTREKSTDHVTLAFLFRGLLDLVFTIFKTFLRTSVVVAALSNVSVSADYAGAVTQNIAASVTTSDMLPKTAPRGIPRGVIHLDQALPQLIWVDLERGSMHLLERKADNTFEQVNEIPTSIGKLGYGKFLEGDLKTPVGVYQVTSYLNDNKVADKYGNGAFPLNYPNIYDRLRRRTGSGIWIHGLPKGVSSRPKLDSDGCVVIDNNSFDWIMPRVKTGETLVVLGGELAWQTQPDPSYDILMDTLTSWHHDWQKIDTPAYLAHYAGSFTDTRRNIDTWRSYKTRVNKAKRWIEVDMQKMSVVAYPEEPDLVAVRFYQTYKSNNYNWRGWKHLLWRKGDDNQWRIVYEGNG